MSLKKVMIILFKIVHAKNDIHHQQSYSKKQEKYRPVYLKILTIFFSKKKFPRKQICNARFVHKRVFIPRKYFVD